MSGEIFRTMIERQAKAFAEKVFMNIPGTGEEMTYAELADEVKERGEVFLTRGLAKGEKLLLLMSNSRSFILNYFLL